MRMRKGPVASAWYLSFGDLLTLLLAFFITTITLSPLNPASGGRYSAAESGTTIALDPLSGSGTRNANIANKTRQLVHFMSSTAFLSHNGDLTPEAQDEIKKLVVAEGYRIERAQIELCQNPNSGTDFDPWLLTESQISGLARQLVDIGVDQQALKLRVLGPHCNALLSPSEESKAKLVLDFIRS